tara:strand:+ start:572 stop:916 length:345 start_codon:yes stop_codon:yes gene_type:complete
MSFSGCRSSGLLTNTQKNGATSAEPHLVHSGRCKLVSIHVTNLHMDSAGTLTVYDNTAVSGKIVARLYIVPLTDGGLTSFSGNTLEFDMHGVICENGIMVDFTGGTLECTIEYA